MTMTRIALLATVALLGTQTTAAAQDPRPPRPARGEAMMGTPGAMPLERLKARLNLTDDQVKKIEALRTAQANRPSREPDVLRAQADLMQAMQGNGDLAAARKAMDRMNAVRTDAMIARLEQRQALLGILTAEQRTQFAAMRGMRGDRGMRMGMGRGMGGGHRMDRGVGRGRMGPGMMGGRGPGAGRDFGPRGDRRSMPPALRRPPGAPGEL
jgi:Spy/CpxP family protein refolding chaperone